MLLLILLAIVVIFFVCAGLLLLMAVGIIAIKGITMIVLFGDVIGIALFVFIVRRIMKKK